MNEAKPDTLRRTLDRQLDEAALECGNFVPLFGVLKTHSGEKLDIMPQGQGSISEKFKEYLHRGRFDLLRRVDHGSVVYVLRGHPDSKTTAATMEDVAFVMCGPYILSRVVSQTGIYVFSHAILREEREETGEKEIAAERAERSKAICTSRISTDPPNWPDDIVDGGMGNVFIRLSRLYIKQDESTQGAETRLLEKKRTHSHESPDHDSDSKRKKERTSPNL